MFFEPRASGPISSPESSMSTLCFFRCASALRKIDIFGRWKDMCSKVFGAGFPLKSAIVTLSFPIATPLSNSNCLRKPRTRSNQRALFFGLRTARPKWPTTPRVNGTFIFMFQTAIVRVKKRTHRSMIALALILCAAIAAMGVTVIVAPAKAHDLARLFADKTGMWIATAIRAVLALCLLAAASESKAPMLLRLLGLLILIVAILIPILGLDRHRRMIDWWIARPRTAQMFWGAATFVFGIALIYLIL